MRRFVIKRFNLLSRRPLSTGSSERKQRIAALLLKAARDCCRYSFAEQDLHLPGYGIESTSTLKRVVEASADANNNKLKSSFARMRPLLVEPDRATSRATRSIALNTRNQAQLKFNLLLRPGTLSNGSLRHCLDGSHADSNAREGSNERFIA